MISGIYSKVNGEPAENRDFIIFTSYTGNPVFDEILKGSEAAVLETCYKAGRLVPVEYNSRKAAIEKSEGSDREDLYRNAALSVKSDIYAVLTLSNEKGDYILNLNLIPLNDKYKDLKCGKTVRSRIPENIPLKTAREFANILKRVSLRSDVVRILDDGSAIINSGQWHGLEEGSYSTDAGTVVIKNVSRYTAAVRGVDFTGVRTLTFYLFPRLEDFISKINYDLRSNTVRVYGTDEYLNKKDGVVKGSIQGTCVINMGANCCLPGYGSFLSIDYMGVENGKPDYAGILITAALTTAHLGLVPYLTDFEVMYFPWIKDNDRSKGIERLNYFLWGTIPFTFSASFFSQLEYNYKSKNLLPPNFADADASAALVSVFFPGGGIFYKGYRWTGWGVYLGEMSLAGYAVYEGDRKKRDRLLASLAVFKCAEIIASYFIPVSYSFFNREISSAKSPDFSAGLSVNPEGGREFTASVSLRY